MSDYDVIDPPPPDAAVEQEQQQEVPPEAAVDDKEEQKSEKAEGAGTNSRDSAEADFSTSVAVDNEPETEVEPGKAEYSDVGELTGKLSELSENLEKEEQHHQSQSKFGKWLHRVRPLIQGRFMAFLVIANMVLVFLIICSIIVLIVLGTITLVYNSKLNSMLEQQKNDKMCAVIWDNWSDCSAPCTTDMDQPPIMTRKVKAIYGNFGNNCNMDTITEEKMECNLYNCEKHLTPKNGTTTAADEAAQSTAKTP